MTLLDVALVVDADEVQRNALKRALRERWRDVLGVASVEEGLELLLENDQIGLVIVDVSAFEQGPALASAAVLKLPTPLVIALCSTLDPAAAFAMGKAGVRALVRKPCTTDEVLRAIEGVEAEEPPPIVPWVAPFVGRVGLFDFESDVRRALVLQALLASDESRSAAARLLHAPRPVIQRAAPPKLKKGGPRRRRR